MAKRLQPLAQILRLVDSLNDSEREVLRDYLRPERKKAGKSPAPAAGKKSSSLKNVRTDGTPNSGTPSVGEVVAARASGD